MDIPPLDDGALTAGYDATAGDLGRLRGLAVWLAGVQGAIPPEPLRRRRFVVFGDAAPAAVETLAGPADVTVTVVPYDAPGPIATGPATTRERARAAYAAGIALAGREADSGTGVILTRGADDPVTAAAIACALTGAEPVEAVRNAGDAGWARDVATVRDALRRSGFAGLDADGLMAELGGEALAAQAGLIAGAARRRTPVLIDGATAAAAALLANAGAPGCTAYVAAAQRATDPAYGAMLDALELTPLLDLGIAADGVAAVLALGLLDAAIALV
jgi:nicotinate-nucleotide--dimethylbenzimidazole phosphoribosyltransferase